MRKGLRLIQLVFGLFLFALGLVIVMRGNLGYSSWEIFHEGLTNLLPLTIGQATILVSVIIVGIIMLLKEKIGVGTLANMALIGLFMDIILVIDFIPTAIGIISGLCFIIAGLFVAAFGSYFYISSGFGAGPRDSLMVAICKKTGLPIGICRSLIECSVAVAGWILGGTLGIGTVIAAFGLGWCIQIVFRLFSFEATRIKHESLLETLHIRKVKLYNNSDI